MRITFNLFLSVMKLLGGNFSLGEQFSWAKLRAMCFSSSKEWCEPPRSDLVLLPPAVCPSEGVSGCRWISEVAVEG